MSLVVRNLPPIKTFTSSGGAAVSFGLGLLDDANSVTLFFTSSFTGTTTTATLQVTQFDPSDAAALGSSAWYNLSTALVTSSGMALTLTNISFRGLRVNGFTATSSQAGEVIAFASKQISV